MGDLVLQVATITLQDDDVRGVVVEPRTLVIDEGGEDTYTVRLTAQPTADVTVSVAVPGGTPVRVDPAVVTFTRENWSTAQSVTVHVDDDDDAVMHEDVELTHTVGGGDYVGVTAAAVTVTLRETTLPQVTIGDAVAAEAAGALAFTVTLDVESSAEVTVAWATTAETATAGADYTESRGTVRFPPGSLRQTLTVPILDDDLDEANETFTVTLSAPEHASLGEGEATEATGTIADDDESPALTLSPAAPRAAESAGSVAFTVTLGAGSAREVTVSYATSDGTATAGADYTAGSGTLTFRPDEALTQTISVPILPDDLDEADETFTLALSDPVNASAADDASATVTITDDDERGVTVAPTTLEVEEGGDGAYTWS